MLKLKNASTDPAYNLAFEEYFTTKAQELGDSIIFFWRNRPAVIVGRFQNTFGEVDATLAKQHGIDVVRRNTGGGAVYHDLNNLNYSFIIPAESDDYIKDAKSTAPFDLLFGIILKLLASQGVQAEQSGRNDLIVDGRKISGAARQLTKNALLLHGTLLFDVDLETLGKVLSADPVKYESKGLKSVRSRVCNLKELMPAGMDITAFQQALENSLEAEEYIPSPEDLHAIEELAERKYRSWDWNWGNSPASSLSKKRRFSWGNLELRLQLSNGVIQDAAIYGDFFSDAAKKPGDAIDNLVGGLRGLRYQSAELHDYLSALSLENIFIGSEQDALLAFFME